MPLDEINLSQLKFFHFINKEGQDIGILEDLVLENDTLVPTHIVLGGGFFEEYLETRGTKDDIDELVRLEDIDQKDDESVIISKPLDQMEQTDKEGNLPFSGIKFSTIQKLPVLINDVKEDVELRDILINGEDTEFVFLVPKLSSELYPEKYYQKFHIYIPIEKVSKTNEALYLNLDLPEIISHIKDNYEPKPGGKTIIHY